LTNPARRYGPHDPEFAATLTVTVLMRGRQEVQVPLSPATLRQRRQINDLAHLGYIRPDEPLPREPLCRTCLKPAARCLGDRPATHLSDEDDHPFDPAPT
jgi:hypothetical protein